MWENKQDLIEMAFTADTLSERNVIHAKGTPMPPEFVPVRTWSRPQNLPEVSRSTAQPARRTKLKTSLICI